jgi:hypothetical protein
MKTRLIHRYYELREQRQWAKLNSSLDASLLALQMMRVDHILFMRYGYDISLQHQLN